MSQSGAGVGVAIVDTGLDFGHDDIAPSLVCFTGYASCQDGNGHGTHVGEIVSVLNNTIDVVGVAPNATLYAVKVLSDSGSGDDATVIAGLDWVVANANIVSPNIRVINMSLGRPTSSDDSAMHAAIQAVEAAGITVVVSAGNNSSVEATDNVPAGFAEVMSVASVTAEDGKSAKCGQILADTASTFTTDGPTVAISAPGENKEDVKGCIIRGVGILSLDLGNGTTRKSGTSMSSPHVAGVVALMWEQALAGGGSLTPADAASRIASGADMIAVAPLNSPTGGYSFDGTREGVLSASGALAP